MEIVTPIYDSAKAKSEFKNRLKASIDYLCEFSEQEHPNDIEICWRVCAAHYLAIVSAEAGDQDAMHLYLSYLKNLPSRKNIDVLPIVDNGSIENKMIARIIEDDAQVGFGYCVDLTLAQQEQNKILTALDVIKNLEPDAYKEIENYIDTVYLTMASAYGSRFMRSGTNFYMWGMMFLYINSEHTIPYYIEHIVHECAHTALNLINSYDELVTNSAEEAFDAPFRKDSRPMIGIFHAYFVLSRICYVFDKIKSTVNADMREEINERFNNALQKLKETHDIVEKHSRFTPQGEKIYVSIKKLWHL